MKYFIHDGQSELGPFTLVPNIEKFPLLGSLTLLVPA